MEILSVNVGQKRTQPKGNGLETTGIYKTPEYQPVQVGRLGLTGDFICDQKNHGGPDQAVYIYGEPDYAWWSAQSGRVLEPGTFGENLTLSEFESANVRIGDRLQIGSLVLEFTAPRIPCSTLARRMRDPKFVKAYRQAEKPGVYCRVIQEGPVMVGDAATLIPNKSPTVSNLEIFRAHMQRQPDPVTLRRILQAPISVRMREDMEEVLQKLGR